MSDQTIPPAEDAIDIRLQAGFSSMINSILSRFASSTGSEIDENIVTTLREVCLFVGADASYVIQANRKMSHWSATHYWRAPGVPAVAAKYQKVPLSTHSWSEQILFAGGIIRLRSLDDLPPEAVGERKAYGDDGVRSLLSVPLRGRGGCIIGCVGFRSYSRHLAIPDDVVQAVQMVADAIANVLERQWVEDALRESESKYRNLVETTQTGYVVVDFDGMVYDANAEFIRLTGRESADDVIGHTILEWSANPEQNAAALRRCVDAGFVRNLEIDYAAKDGATTTVEINATVVDTREGKRIIAICRDITDRVLNDEKVSKAFRSSPNVLLISRLKDNRIVEVNDSFEKFSGYQREEAVGRTATELGLWWDLDDRDRILQRLATEGRVRNEEVRFQTRTGEPLVGVTSIDTLDVRGDKCWLVVVTNITDQKRVEASLLNAERELQEVINGYPIPTFVIDKQHRVTHWNKAIEKLSCIPAEEIRGTDHIWKAFINEPRRCMADILLDGDMAEFEQFYAGKYRRSEVLENAYEAIDLFHLRDGTNRWLAFSASILKDTRGNTIGAIETLEDITERKLAEEELRRYRDHLEELVKERTDELEHSRKEAVRLMQDANTQRHRTEVALKALRQSEEQLRQSEFELRVSNEHLARAQAVAHVGHFTWDLLTDIITGSAEYHHIRKTTPDTLNKFEDILKTIHPDDREQWLAVVRAVKAGEKPYVVDYRLLLSDGTVKYVHAQGETTCDEHGKPILLFGAMFDVTDTKIAEARLKDAIIAAETANRAKSAFLANMSHELRTPLTAVLGFTQLLREDPTLTKSQKENLDIINRSGEHLLSLINDVLEMSKIESGQLGLQEGVFDLWTVLDSIEEMLRVRAGAKHLTFRLVRDAGVPRYVKADARRLKQVLINLAGNALKFTHDGSVTIRVRLEPNKEMLHCEVEDTGPGIRVEDQSRLFNRFVQVGEGNEGVGLGLYISRKLVELMGGRIAVESEQGKGSRFLFNIRCQSTVTEGMTTESASRRVVAIAPGQPHFRILVVDDKFETRLFVVKMLEAVGFTVEEAENGREAVTRFEAGLPDLVLMDMRMPIMDGYEAIRRIKATEHGKATPVIAVTASAFEEERSNIFQAGANGFLGKPLQIDELFETIGEHLGVVYVYSNAATSVDSALIDVAALEGMIANLPDELANKLADAASVLDMDSLNAMMPEVASHNAFLAEQLASLTREYHIAKLTELLGTRRSS